MLPLTADSSRQQKRHGFAYTRLETARSTGSAHPFSYDMPLADPTLDLVADSSPEHTMSW